MSVNITSRTDLALTGADFGRGLDLGNLHMLAGQLLVILLGRTSLLGTGFRLFGNCRAALTGHGSGSERCKQARNESRSR